MGPPPFVKRRSRDQWLDQQIKALEAAGCIRIFADKKSGNNAEREELRKALDYLRPGDILVVSSLDRLGRSLQDLISIVAGLRKQGVGLRSLKESIDTTTPGGRLVFHVFAALAEFVRELIVEGAHEGLDSARARGQRLGRPPAMTPEQVAHARALLAQPDASVASIARLLRVSRSTIYKYVPGTQARRRPGRRAARRPVPRADRGLHRTGRHPRVTTQPTRPSYANCSAPGAKPTAPRIQGRHASLALHRIPDAPRFAPHVQVDHMRTVSGR